MSLFSRLFSSKPDPREELRPLWLRTVEIARAPRWYADLGVADTVAGRFDMVTAVLATVLVRLESDPSLVARSALLTELFVHDMDGQLREFGIGDIVVGKHIGKLMATMGGRLGAYRDGLDGDASALGEAVSRNVTLLEGAGPQGVAGQLRAFSEKLHATDSEAVLSGGFTL